MHFSAGYLIILPVGTDKGLNYTPRSRFWKNALFVQLFVWKHPRKKVVYEEKESNFGGPGKKKNSVQIFPMNFEKVGSGGGPGGFWPVSNTNKIEKWSFSPGSMPTFLCTEFRTFFSEGGGKARVENSLEQVDFRDFLQKPASKCIWSGGKCLKQNRKNPIRPRFFDP